MRDLLMPVGIRDWWINIKGRVLDDDIELKPDPEYSDEMIPDDVPYAETSGYGVTITTTNRVSVEI